MKELLKIELKRGFQNYAFLIAVLIGVLITVSHYIMNVIPMVQYLDLYKQPEEIMLYPHSVFNKWIGGESHTVQPTLYFMLLPLLAVFPYGDSFFMDEKSGFVKNLFLKTEKRNYFVSKYIAVFLSGGCAVVLPLLLNLVLTAATLPSLIPQPGAQTFGIFSADMWSGIYYSHPYAYVFLYLLIIFLFGGFLAVLGLVVSFFVQNRFLVLLAPFVVCLFVHSIFNLVDLKQFDILNFLSPSQMIDGIRFPIILGEMLLLAAATIGVFFGKGLHDDTF